MDSVAYALFKSNFYNILVHMLQLYLQMIVSEKPKLKNKFVLKKKFNKEASCCSNYGRHNKKASYLEQ